MDKLREFVLWFDQVGIEDTPLVGGKNAALGEMYRNLTPMGIKVPNGFAVTSYAYNYFIEQNDLKKAIYDILKDLDTHNIRQLQQCGQQVRNLILTGSFPEDLKNAIWKAYDDLGLCYFKDPDVAVRSSATAEDLPDASFAGEQETYLNVRGKEKLLLAVKKCFASLFTDRAISYRNDKKFDHFKIALSVGVQKMVRSDLAGSGVAFTLDTETGFDKVIVINGAYGLGELIVQGQVIPDEWIVYKEALKKGYKAIIAKSLGEKSKKIIYGKERQTELVDVSSADYVKFVLTDEEVLKLAKWCSLIEEHFSQKRGKFQPMDIEWAKDGEINELFIVQARPETVHSTKQKNVLEEYKLEVKGKELLRGIAVGTKIATGKVRIIKDVEKIHDFQKGEILVTEITDPDWEPIMKIASGIITDKGGRTSHAAIVSRELGIPCIVGAQRATSVLKTGQMITMDCSSGVEGVIFDKILDYKIIKHDLGIIPETRTHVMVNIGSPAEAFKNHFLPVKGVGLAREEFILASHIRIHPNVLIDYFELKERSKKLSLKSQKLKFEAMLKEIESLTAGYEDKRQYYVDKLAYGIAKIGVAFAPYQVIVRFSDFKTNEYRTLLGGELYEPHEENPMIGWRGASRYYDPKFAEAFKLEVKAIKKVREEMGVTNIVPMIPFVRTVEEVKRVIEIMRQGGLERDVQHINSCHKQVQDCDHFRIYMMCEVPSNVILADEFLELVDGYSIGSNDLTQLTLGLDRDAGILAHIGNENNEAVKIFIRQVIKKCLEKHKYIGICGQAPSDIEGYAEFLVKGGIESISLNPDTVIKTILKISQIEKSI